MDSNADNKKECPEKKGIASMFCAKAKKLFFRKKKPTKNEEQMPLPPAIDSSANLPSGSRRLFRKEKWENLHQEIMSIKDSIDLNNIPAVSLQGIKKSDAKTLKPVPNPEKRMDMHLRRSDDVKKQNAETESPPSTRKIILRMRKKAKTRFPKDVGNDPEWFYLDEVPEKNKVFNRKE